MCHLHDNPEKNNSEALEGSHILGIRAHRILEMLLVRLNPGKMRPREVALALLVWGVCASFANAGHGVIGDVVRFVGQRTGVAQITQLGNGLDQANRDIKDSGLIPGYKEIEETGSAAVQQLFLGACGAAYQAITQPLVAKCSNTPGRMQNRSSVQQAQNALVRTGLFGLAEFSRVDIRACPLGGFAEGIAPDRGLVYLDPSAFDEDPAEFGALIAHEMTHIRQYGRGTDKFKCDYSRDYIDCGLCQNRQNGLEREAYEEQDKARAVLNEYYYPNKAPPVPSTSNSVTLPDPASTTGRVALVNTLAIGIFFEIESASFPLQKVLLNGNSSIVVTGGPDDSVFNIYLTSGQFQGAPQNSLSGSGPYYFCLEQQIYLSTQPCVVAQPVAHNNSSDIIHVFPQRANTLPGSPATLMNALTVNPDTSRVVPSDFDRKGLLVESVVAGSWADEAGFERDDVIREVNDRKVATVAELRAALQSGSGQDGTVVVVSRPESGKLHREYLTPTIP